MTEPKAILITGAARRIGRHMALRLAADGYDIALHYNGSRDDAERTATEIEALGRKVVLLQADLSDKPDYTGIITQAKQALPHLCGLIHNASIFAPSAFLDSDEAAFDANFQLHVKAPFFLSQAYAKKVGKGSIICLLDTNVSAHASVHFTYLASKKALAELTQMLARELAPSIRVNAIAPGLTSLSDDVSPEQASAKAQSLPLNVIAQPEQIADAAAYLLRAEYLIGHTLYIDGGQQLL